MRGNAINGRAASDTTAKAENPIRILLVDDQTLVREGMRLLIERHAGLAIIGEARDCPEAIHIAGREQPEIILLDRSVMDARMGIIDELLEVSGSAQIVILARTEDAHMHCEAMRMGARGVVFKQQASDVLIKAIRKVNAGEVWFDRPTVARLLAEISSATRSGRGDPIALRVAALTPREREVVNLVAGGMKNKQIAECLFISEATVSHHLTSIFGKLGLTDRSQLIVFAYKYRLAKIWN